MRKTMMPPGGWNRPFETRWKPKSWNAGHRLILIGKRVKRQHRQPIQPDLFRPVEYGYEFRVIVTNRRTDPRDVVAFHEGRWSQEGIFAEPGMHTAKWITYRSGPGRKPIVHARRYPCPQPHPRTADPNRPLRTRHDPEACRIAVLPGDGNPSPYLHPAHRMHYSTGRKINPLHEQRRQFGRGAQTCPHGIECRLIDVSLRQFMQQSG